MKLHKFYSSTLEGDINLLRASDALPQENELSVPVGWETGWSPYLSGEDDEKGNPVFLRIETRTSFS
jgi:hypothetical protein